MRASLPVLAGACLAALPVLAGGALAADASARAPAARTLTVTRVASDCPPLPAVVARGRRGVGEPGSFYAYWDWVVPASCNVVIGR
ncbi:MAG: hypothetical protein JWN07_2321 [Hyphomicrobiales bacterium]|nr:hypothetical protein [Hyphomicrobiales bacterium]